MFWGFLLCALFSFLQLAPSGAVLANRHHRDLDISASKRLCFALLHLNPPRLKRYSEDPLNARQRDPLALTSLSSMR
jgi:hypothetical protein